MEGKEEEISEVRNNPANEIGTAEEKKEEENENEETNEKNKKINNDKITIDVKEITAMKTLSKDKTDDYETEKNNNNDNQNQIVERHEIHSAKLKTGSIAKNVSDPSSFDDTYETTTATTTDKLKNTNTSTKQSKSIHPSKRSQYTPRTSDATPHDLRVIEDRKLDRYWEETEDKLKVLRKAQLEVWSLMVQDSLTQFIKQRKEQWKHIIGYDDENLTN